MNKDNLIGIVMATNLEADPVVERLGLCQVRKTPFKIYEGRNIIMIRSGIGKSNAAMATLYLITEFSPNVILNLGAAGALTEGHPIGSVYQIEKAAEADRPIIKDNSIRFHKPERLEGFDEAILSTRDEGVVTPLDRRNVSIFADLADMEGCAVIQACKRMKTPCYLFKFVSDTPDHQGHHDIVKNIEEYRGSFASYIKDNILPNFHTNDK